MSKDGEHINLMRSHFESYLVVPISTCIDDLALSQTARFDTVDLSDNPLSNVPELLDLTTDEELSSFEQRSWSCTPQQRMNRLKREYPNSSESTLQRRLHKLQQVRPIKLFYSSHAQATLHLSCVDRTKSDWESMLVADAENIPSTDTIVIDLSEDGIESTKVEVSEQHPHLGSLLHPLSKSEHPASFSSIESKSSCISDSSWFPVLDTVTRFFSDASSVSSGLSAGFSALMEMDETGITSPKHVLRKVEHQSPYCLDSGLSEEWEAQLKQLWSQYPSQIFLFIQKHMVIALREVRSKLLNASSPPPPWTFWRRPDTPLCGLASPNAFNPSLADIEADDFPEDDEEPTLSPNEINSVSGRKSQFVVPAQGVSLGPMDALSVAVLHRVLDYWEAMKVKVKPLAQLIDFLMKQNEKNENFTSLMWLNPTHSSDPTKTESPSVSYYFYNPFSVQGQDMELHFEWIFQLLFRTVVLRHYSIRTCLRRACFIYRQLFSLDQPKELADMIRIRNFEADLRFMDENAWHWKFRLSSHLYISSSRVAHDISVFPMLYSPLIVPILANLKDAPRQRQGSTLSNRWPLLSSNHLKQIAQMFPIHRYGSRGKYIPGPNYQAPLLFPISMPIEWRLLKGETIAHPRITEVLSLSRKRFASSFDLTQLEGLSRYKEASPGALERVQQNNQDKRDASSEDDLFNELFRVPSAVAGYVTPTILTTILQSRMSEFDEEWSDDSDADYPEEDLDHTLGHDDFGGSEGSHETEHSEYEYYDSDDPASGVLRGDEDIHKSLDFLEDDLSDMGAHQRITGTKDRVRARTGAATSSGSEIRGNGRGLSGGPSRSSDWSNLSIDWSKLDAKLVETVMGAKSREEIAQAIAKRLGIIGGQLSYEIADLIPATFLQRDDSDDEELNRVAKKYEKLWSTASHPKGSSLDHMQDHHSGEGYDSATSSVSDSSEYSSSESWDGELHFRQMQMEAKSKSQPTRVGIETIFLANHDPFEAYIGPGLALPVPGPPPYPHPRWRYPLMHARTLTQPFLSDEEEDEEEFVETKVDEPFDLTPGSLSKEPIYPYSVAARLHDLRMNDPYEGTSTYKLKMMSHLDDSDHFETSEDNGDPTRSQQKTGVTRQKTDERSEKQKSTNATPNPPDPNIPGITDTSKSVDELMRFIEGTPSKTKAGKKKNANQDKKGANPTPSAKTTASTSQIAQSKATSTKEKPSDAKKTESISSSVAKVQAETTTKNKTMDPPTANSTNLATNQASPANSTSLTPSSIPSTSENYPEFWSVDDSSLDPEERKALDEEIAKFQDLMDSTFQPLAAVSSLTNPSEKISTSKADEKKKVPPNGATSKTSAASSAVKLASLATPMKIVGTVFSSMASTARTDARNIFKKTYSNTAAPATAPQAQPGKAKNAPKKRK